MQEFVSKLGIDWKLLLSQTVNFLILLAVLRVFAYKPLIKIMKERRAKIEEGLAKAKEADQRLGEISVMQKEKMKETEQEALALLRATEEKSKKLEMELLEQARQKEAALVRSGELAAEGKKEEARREIQKEAADVVKRAIAKTVEMDPEKIDEALIKKAVEAVSK